MSPTGGHDLKNTYLMNKMPSRHHLRFESKKVMSYDFNDSCFGLLSVTHS